MTNGQWRALCLLSFTALFSFLAGVQHQKKEMVPVDKIMVQEYLDSLLDEKRMKDKLFEEYCNPEARTAFRYWQMIQRQQAEKDTSLIN
jgi:hypothetical protein